MLSVVVVILRLRSCLGARLITLRGVGLLTCLRSSTLWCSLRCLIMTLMRVLLMRRIVPRRLLRMLRCRGVARCTVRLCKDVDVFDVCICTTEVPRESTENNSTPESLAGEAICVV